MDFEEMRNRHSMIYLKHSDLIFCREPLKTVVWGHISRQVWHNYLSYINDRYFERYLDGLRRSV